LRPQQKILFRTPLSLIFSSSLIFFLHPPFPPPLPREAGPRSGNPSFLFSPPPKNSLRIVNLFSSFSPPWRRNSSLSRRILPPPSLFLLILSEKTNNHFLPFFPPSTFHWGGPFLKFFFLHVFLSPLQKWGGNFPSGERETSHWERGVPKGSFVVAVSSEKKPVLPKRNSSPLSLCLSHSFCGGRRRGGFFRGVKGMFPFSLRFSPSFFSDGIVGRFPFSFKKSWVRCSPSKRGGNPLSKKGGGGRLGSVAPL